MTDEEMVELMRAKLIPPSARALASAQEEYRTKPLHEFNDLASFLFEQAVGGLLTEVGGEVIRDLPKGVRVRSLFHAVMQFNAVLPLDYPAVVMALQFNEPPSLSLAIIKRDLVTCLRDALTPGVMILGLVEREADYENNLFDIAFKIAYPKPADDIEEPDPDPAF